MYPDWPRKSTRKNFSFYEKGLDYGKKADIIHLAVSLTVNSGTWSSIEVVITSTTGNRVAANTARGFESLLLRHWKNPEVIVTLGFFVFMRYRKSFVAAFSGTKSLWVRDIITIN